MSLQDDLDLHKKYCTHKHFVLLLSTVFEKNGGGGEAVDHEMDLVHV